MMREVAAVLSLAGADLFPFSFDTQAWRRVRENISRVFGKRLSSSPPRRAERPFLPLFPKDRPFDAFALLLRKGERSSKRDAPPFPRTVFLIVFPSLCSRTLSSFYRHHVSPSFEELFSVLLAE